MWEERNEARGLGKSPVQTNGRGHRERQHGTLFVQNGKKAQVVVNDTGKLLVSGSEKKMCNPVREPKKDKGDQNSHQVNNLCGGHGSREGGPDRH